MWRCQFRDGGFVYALGERFELRRLDRGAGWERLDERRAVDVLGRLAHRIRPELRDVLARLRGDVAGFGEGELEALVRVELESLTGRLALVRRVERVATIRGEHGRQAPADCAPETSWIELELVDDAGAPVVGARFEMRSEDGRVRRGITDSTGIARVSGLVPGTCSVTFPDLDGDAWVPGGGSR